MLNAVLTLGLAPGPQAGNPLVSLMPIALIFVIFYFLLIRPQQKQRKAHEEMIQRLKKGDHVVTTGGIHGMIAGVKERSIMLKVAEGIKIEIQKNAVGYLKKAEGAEKEA